LPPSVSRLSRQCGILNILQPYRPPWPVTGIALLFYFTFYCLYSGPVVLSIYSPDDGDYLIMHVNFVVIMLLIY
jgi:hypothetical protein